MVRTFFIVWLFLLSTFTQAAVNAEVDRTQVGEGESFTLTLTSDGSSGDNPDLSILDANFDVVGRSNSSNISIMNGQMSSQKSWQIQLIPKNVTIGASIFIPPITIGNEKTQPITIQVTNQSSNSSQNSTNPNAVTARTDNNVFFETTVDKKEVYVQGQIIYTERFYYRDGLPISDISAEDLTVEGASVEALNTKQKPYRKEINGILYQVSEATYAIFPQKSGQLRIPAQNLTVHMQTSLFDPPRQMRIHSEENVINVLPQPNHDNPWLPAKTLLIKETWSKNSGIFKVGESVTRKITIEAEGLNQSQLPALPDIKLDGIKTYVDKPEIKNGITINGTGMQSSRTDSVAIVATKPGTYTLPEITIKWWNTVKNAEEFSRVPAFTFTVENNPSTNQTALPAPVVDAQTNSTSTPSSEEISHFDLKNQLWLIIAGVFLILWILTLLLWWRTTHRKINNVNDLNTVKTDKPKINVPKSAAFDELSLACQNNDPIKTRDSLLKWALNRWPINTPSTLEDIAVKEPTLADALRALEYALYAKQAGGWQGSQLLVLIKQLSPITHIKEQKSPLESLYPSS